MTRQPAHPQSRRITSHLRAVDPVLAQLVRAVGPYRLRAEPAHSTFRHLVRAITSQQLNGTAAATILRRFCELYGCSAPEAFPTPHQVLATEDAKLRGCGLSGGKIRALKDLSDKTLSGLVQEAAALAPLGDEEIVARLTQIRGIGRWTVEMMLMFQLGRADVLPVDDFGVRNGFRLAYGLREMPAPRALAKFGERWAPFRSAAAWYLWRAVDLARAGTLPQPLRPPPRLPKPKRAKKKKSARKKRQ
jgi:3-methyladenine DNA glycosylase/8-oxoguanine DNA glycosylase